MLCTQSLQSSCCYSWLAIIINSHMLIETAYEKHRFMLCRRNVHQHAGAKDERCRPEKRRRRHYQSDMMDYGMMKGDAVLDKALKLLE